MNVRNSNEEMNFTPMAGSQELAVAGLVVTAEALPNGATHAMVSVKGNGVHMGFFTEPATAGAGILLAAGTRLMLRRYAMDQAKFIQAENAKAATLCIEPGTF